MIAVINCGFGNILSIVNMLKSITREDICIVEDSKALMQADKIILPGVGSFDHGIEKLKDSGIDCAIHEKVLNQECYFLGVCLGMQLLFENSEEGQKQGLGLIKGNVKKFSFTDMKKPLPVPHMGWNSVQPMVADSILSEDAAYNEFYFVHSYYVTCDQEHIIGTTNYGYDFPSVVRKNNIYGVQFHPEKSHNCGKKLLSNFVNLGSKDIENA